jgi:hypothetical protein
MLNSTTASHFLGDLYATECQLLTKAQVVKIFGDFNVELVGKINADFSNRRINKDVVEFISSILVKDENNDEVMLTAHCYQNKSDVDSCDSLDLLTWEIAGYSVL